MRAFAEVRDDQSPGLARYLELAGEDPSRSRQASTPRLIE
jgi:hypothetical protein